MSSFENDNIVNLLCSQICALNHSQTLSTFELPFISFHSLLVAFFLTHQIIHLKFDILEKSNFLLLLPYFPQSYSSCVLATVFVMQIRCNNFYASTMLSNILYTLFLEKGLIKKLKKQKKKSC